MHDSKISTMPDAPLRILGIDPGLQLTGYGVVEIPHENKGNPLADPTLVEAGVLRFKSRDSVATRVAQLHAELQAIINARFQKSLEERKAAEKAGPRIRPPPRRVSHKPTPDAAGAIPSFLESTFTSRIEYDAWVARQV